MGGKFRHGLLEKLLIETINYFKFPVAALKLKPVSVLYPLELGSNLGKGRVQGMHFFGASRPKRVLLGHVLGRHVEVFPQIETFSAQGNPQKSGSKCHGLVQM